MHRINIFKALQFFLFIISPSFAQVNTEAMRTSNDNYGFTNALGFDLGFEKSNEEVVEIAGKYRLDFVAKNGLNSFLILSYENGYQKIDSKTNSIVNKGFGHLRFTKDIGSEIFIELFTQYGFNDFLLMKERFLFGSGVRYQVSSGDKIKTHLGIGFMQEDEIYDIKENREMSLLRSTNYITFNLKLSENTQLNNTAYFQFDTKRFEDNRILFDSDMAISINDKLTFNFVINYRQDSEPHGDLGTTYIQLKNGFEYIF